MPRPSKISLVNFIISLFVGWLVKFFFINSIISISFSWWNIHSLSMCVWGTIFPLTQPHEMKCVRERCAALITIYLFSSWSEIEWEKCSRKFASLSRVGVDAKVLITQFSFQTNSIFFFARKNSSLSLFPERFMHFFFSLLSLTVEPKFPQVWMSDVHDEIKAHIRDDSVETEMRRRHINKASKDKLYVMGTFDLYTLTCARDSCEYVSFHTSAHIERDTFEHEVKKKEWERIRHNCDDDDVVMAKRGFYRSLLGTYGSFWVCVCVCVVTGDYCLNRTHWLHSEREEETQYCVFRKPSCMHTRTCCVGWYDSCEFSLG